METFGSEGAAGRDFACSLAAVSRHAVAEHAARDDVGGVPLAQALSAAIERVRGALTSRAQRLERELPTAPLLVEADPARLADLVFELLDNASKFSGRNALIELRAEARGRVLVLTVRDEGCGIAPAMLESILAGGPGPGIRGGLERARRIAALHGGTLEGYSPGAGFGSQFTVQLPVAVMAGADPAPEPRAPADKRRRVLIVDDNADAADTLAALLSLVGHDPLVAYGAAGALDHMRRAHPEVVLLDIGMPRMDGCEVARQVRNDASLAGIKLVAITGFGEEHDVRRSMEAGFDLHLIKPVELDALQGVFRRLFSAA